jgi:hypothetical protein
MSAGKDVECELFVSFGFWRLVVFLLLLLVLFFLVVIAVGVSRRHRVIYEAGKPLVGQDKNVLKHALPPR